MPAWTQLATILKLTPPWVKWPVRSRGGGGGEQGGLSGLLPQHAVLTCTALGKLQDFNRTSNLSAALASLWPNVSQAVEELVVRRVLPADCLLGARHLHVALCSATAASRGRQRGCGAPLLDCA